MAVELDTVFAPVAALATVHAATRQVGGPWAIWIEERIADARVANYESTGVITSTTHVLVDGNRTYADTLEITHSTAASKGSARSVAVGR